MKRYGYKDYADFNEFRGNRVEDTEAAFMAAYQKSIDKLIKDKDYESLWILSDLAAALAKDVRKDSAVKWQDDLLCALDNITDADEKRMSFVAEFLLLQKRK